MGKLKQFLYGFLLMTSSLLLMQCKEKSDKTNTDKTPENMETKATVTIEKSTFGTTKNGESVGKYTLKNQNGIEVDIITYGGIITSLKVPNKDNISEDIVLGFDSLAQYTKSSPYFGAIIGRYGNRIAQGKFTLDGKEYDLAKNDGQNHLHGGIQGFDKVNWKATESVSDDKASLKLSYLSKDLEEGYPGNLQTDVTYTLNNNNELEVFYEATTDKKTVVNLTQHSYFNLSGDFSKKILDHELMIDADAFIPVNSALIPTGVLEDVTGTPFDFRQPKLIGKDIEESNDQLKKGLGYDHSWVLNNQNNGMRLAASAYHPESGRLLEVFTDEPGVQLYTGNFLDGTLPAKGGGTYAQRTGFCLETQHYPDSPNQPNFPTVVLNSDEKYTSKTTFKFSVK